MLTRITFLTIGQTPRDDLVPEIASRLPRPVPVREVGALDGLDGATIASLEPGPEDKALVTRLRDGSQVVIAKRWIGERLQRQLDAIDTPQAGAADRRCTEATVLLCTGDFPELTGPGLFLDAQHLVDHGVDALCHSAESVGLLVPLERQEGEHHYVAPRGQRLRVTHASPYSGDDFEAAGNRLADCEVVVMHCMGYTETQRAAVAEGSGRPVLLARRLVASALAQLL